MDQRERLIFYLRETETKGYPPVGEAEQTDALRLMMQLVGDTDPALRDELIYSTLHQWILKKAYLDDNCMTWLLRTALDEDHLIYGLGNRDDDTVFTRTFSALAVSLALARHRQKPFITADRFAETKDRLIHYYQSERDLRGYVEGRGWAHGAAHAADALDELALCEECTPQIHREILDAIACLIRGGSCILCHHEDDRITNVLYSVYSAKLLSADELIVWFNLIAEKPINNYSYAGYVTMTNARNLIRSVYFRFLREGCDESLLKLLIGLEGRLHRG